MFAERRKQDSSWRLALPLDPVEKSSVASHESHAVRKRQDDETGFYHEGLEVNGENRVLSAGSRGMGSCQSREVGSGLHGVTTMQPTKVGNEGRLASMELHDEQGKLSIVSYRMESWYIVSLTSKERAAYMRAYNKARHALSESVIKKLTSGIDHKEVGKVSKE